MVIDDSQWRFFADDILNQESTMPEVRTDAALADADHRCPFCNTPHRFARYDRCSSCGKTTMRSVGTSLRDDVWCLSGEHDWSGPFRIAPYVKDNNDAWHAWRVGAKDPVLDGWERAIVGWADAVRRVAPRVKARCFTYERAGITLAGRSFGLSEPESDESLRCRLVTKLLSEGRSTARVETLHGEQLDGAAAYEGLFRQGAQAEVKPSSMAEAAKDAADAIRCALSRCRASSVLRSYTVTAVGATVVVDAKWIAGGALQRTFSWREVAMFGSDVDQWESVVAGWLEDVRPTGSMKHLAAERDEAGECWRLKVSIGSSVRVSVKRAGHPASKSFVFVGWSPEKPVMVVADGKDIGLTSSGDEIAIPTNTSRLDLSQASSATKLSVTLDFAK